MGAGGYAARLSELLSSRQKFLLPVLQWMNYREQIVNYVSRAAYSKAIIVLIASILRFCSSRVVDSEILYLILMAVFLIVDSPGVELFTWAETLPVAVYR